MGAIHQACNFLIEKRVVLVSFLVFFFLIQDFQFNSPWTFGLLAILTPPARG